MAPKRLLEGAPEPNRPPPLVFGKPAGVVELSAPEVLFVFGVRF